MCTWILMLSIRMAWVSVLEVYRVWREFLLHPSSCGTYGLHSDPTVLEFVWMSAVEVSDSNFWHPLRFSQVFEVSCSPRYHCHSTRYRILFPLPNLCLWTTSLTTQVFSDSKISDGETITRLGGFCRPVNVQTGWHEIHREWAVVGGSQVGKKLNPLWQLPEEDQTLFNQVWVTSFFSVYSNSPKVPNYLFGLWVAVCDLYSVTSFASLDTSTNCYSSPGILILNGIQELCLIGVGYPSYILGSARAFPGDSPVCLIRELLIRFLSGRIAWMFGNEY